GPGGAEECPAEVEAAGKCGEGAPDEDIVDEDVVDEDTTDDDPYVNPCLPTNPCVEANKTVCTDTNLDGVEECACVATYHLEETTCVSNTKMVDCVDNAPANATSTIVPVEVTWNGTAWSTPVDCEWDCDGGYTLESGLCINSKMVNCTDAAPANATSTIVPVEVTWNGTAWSTPVDCEWDCDDNFVINGTADGCEPDPCDPNPCSGGTPVCRADETPEGYSCYPDYNVDWCIVQFPKAVEGALLGDKVDLYSRVYIPGITTVTADAIDLHPLLKVQFGGAPVGTPVSEWEADTWTDATPNEGYGNDDEYMVLQHTLTIAGEFDYTFRYSVDAGQTWTVCDTEGNMPYDPAKLGFASVNRIFAKWPLDTDFIADGSATLVDDAVEVTNFVGGSGIGAITWGTNGAFASGWSTGALDLNDYFQVSMKVKDAFAQNIVIDNLLYGERRSGTGIRDYTIRYSKTEDFSSYTDLDSFNVPDNDLTRTNRFDNIGDIVVAPGETIYFRFYGYTSEAAAGTWRMINLSFGGYYQDI
nr:hypothetical protein [bacterium]